MNQCWESVLQKTEEREQQLQSTLQQVCALSRVGRNCCTEDTILEKIPTWCLLETCPRRVALIRWFFFVFVCSSIYLLFRISRSSYNHPYSQTEFFPLDRVRSLPVQQYLGQVIYSLHWIRHLYYVIVRFEGFCQILTINKQIVQSYSRTTLAENNSSFLPHNNIPHRIIQKVLLMKLRIDY